MKCSVTSKVTDFPPGYKDTPTQGHIAGIWFLPDLSIADLICSRTWTRVHVSVKQTSEAQSLATGLPFPLASFWLFYFAAPNGRAAPSLKVELLQTVRGGILPNEF